MNKLYLDFETASECDLKVAGLDNYAKHPTTRVLCMAYAVDDGPVSLWLPGHPLIDASGVSVWAHNSAFEFAIWNHVYNPTNPLVQEQMYCTMSMAAAMGLPQSLEMAALASGIDQKKDTKAHRVMMKLCKPDKNGKFYDPENYPEDFKILYDYCKQDVEVERALAKRLAPLSGREREVWLLDQTINARGVGIDVSSATKFRELIDSEQERLQKDLQQITEGEVLTVGSTAQLKKWMKSKGVEVESIDKAHTQELLHDQSIPGEVIDALLIREEAAKSSNAKYKAMLDGSNDGRVRNLFQYFGATTGRWSGRKVQLQNLPRPKLKQAEIEAAIERPRSISLLHPSVMHVASDCIRGMFIPTEGYSFVCADFSNIEGRIAAWIAGEVWKTEAFSAFDLGRGHDIYRLAYSKAFRIPVEKVTDEQRQIGKVMELALGFGGSVGAFQNMAKNYGVKVSDEKAFNVSYLARNR